MLICRDLTYAYDCNGPPALDGCSATFAAGRLTALVGSNGCGKSTLLKAVMGFLPLTAGNIRLRNRDIGVLGRKAFARQIALLPQENQCPEYLTVGELVELGRYAHRPLWGGVIGGSDRAACSDALDVTGLTSMAHRRVSALSGGQRQRAWLAMVLAQDAELILLDEPVNHLDLKYQLSILSLVRDLVERRGKTVIAVLHDLNLAAQFADDVCVMQVGRVVAEGPLTSALTANVVAEAFDVDVDVVEMNGRPFCVPRSQAPSRAVAE